MSTLAATNLKHASSASNNIVLDSSGNASFQAGTAAAPSIAANGDTNTGVYFSAADTVDVATGGVQRGQFDSSGNFKFNSGYGSVVTAYGCRAWVNFNGTGTPAIRASGNVSSITDFAVGDYQVNITTALPDANYSFQVMAQRNSAGANVAVPAGQASSQYQTASNFRILIYNSSWVNEDPQAVFCAVFR